MHLILVSSWNCFNYLYIFFLFYAPYDVWYIYMIWVQCSSIYPFINDSLSICLKLATKLFYSQDNWCKVQGGISCSSSWCNLPFCWFDWSKPAHIIVHLIFSFLLNCFNHLHIFLLHSLWCVIHLYKMGTVFQNSGQYLSFYKWLSRLVTHDGKLNVAIF